MIWSAGKKRKTLPHICPHPRNVSILHFRCFTVVLSLSQMPQRRAYIAVRSQPPQCIMGYILGLACKQLDKIAQILRLLLQGFVLAFQRDNGRCIWICGPRTLRMLVVTCVASWSSSITLKHIRIRLGKQKNNAWWYQSLQGYVVGDTLDFLFRQALQATMICCLFLRVSMPKS